MFNLAFTDLIHSFSLFFLESSKFTSKPWKAFFFLSVLNEKKLQCDFFYVEPFFLATTERKIKLHLKPHFNHFII